MATGNLYKEPTPESVTNAPRLHATAGAVHVLHSPRKRCGRLLAWVCTMLYLAAIAAVVLLGLWAIVLAVVVAR